MGEAVLGPCTSPASISESGWTAYLDMSNAPRKRLRLSSSSPWSQPSSSSKEDKNLLMGSLVSQELREDDPSMASDASSGPELPESARRERCKWKKAVPVVAEAVAAACPPEYQQDDDMEDTCQSNLSCESVSDDPRRSRQSKRRKAFHLAADRQVSEHIGDGHSDENDVEVESGEAEISSHPALDARRDEVNSRLEVLQHLIPNSRELDEEQVLEVAIHYVKSLEAKIKMFEAAGITKAFIDASSQHSQTISSLSCSTALQDRGWPLSTIAAAGAGLRAAAAAGFVA